MVRLFQGLLLALLVLAPLLASASRPMDRNLLSKELAECQTKICNGAHKYENFNCAAKCLSPMCFAKIYAGNPLEDGEVDENRKTKFYSCAVNEFRAKGKSNWNGKMNVSPEERLLRDSEWLPVP